MSKSHPATAPPELAKALAEFDAGDYFECHETLEGIWRDEPGPVRDLYKGILMIAVGLYHDERGKRKGPLRTFRRALELLSPFTPECMGLDVSGVLAAVAAMREHLLTAPEGSAIQPNLVPRLMDLLKGHEETEPQSD